LERVVERVAGGRDRYRRFLRDGPIAGRRRVLRKIDANDDEELEELNVLSASFCVAAEQPLARSRALKDACELAQGPTRPG
jgi:hypothetical protein